MANHGFSASREHARGMWGLPLLLAGLSAGVTATPLLAQALLPPGSGDGDPGFLFDRPRASLGLRGGIFFHRAGSDFYEFAEDKFTVDRSDFRGASFGVEGSVWVGESTEVNVGIDGSHLLLESEYRDWLEEDGSPIRQTTRITQGPSFSLGARHYLRSRGDALGRFVWIPRRLNGFVGGGAAISAYHLKLEGDFVDEQEETISTARFVSDGNAFLPYLAGGIEIGLAPRASLALEGRYHWGSVELGRDFQDNSGASTFEPMDLSGARLTAGLYFHF